MAISEKLVKINNEVITQETLLAQIQAALEGKAAGGSAEDGIEVIKRTIELDSNSQTITIPDIEKEPKILLLNRRYFLNEYTNYKHGWEDYEGSEYFAICLFYNSNENINIKLTYADYDTNQFQYYLEYADIKNNDDSSEMQFTINIHYDESKKETIIDINDDDNTPLIFIPGSYECYILYDQISESSNIDTSDANATSLDIREGTRAYAQGAPVDGAIPTRSDLDVTVGNTSVVIPAGIYDNDIDLAIKSAGGGTPRIISSDAVQVTNASATSSMTFTFSKPSETAILKGVYVVFSGATSISTGTITSVTYLRDFYKGTNETTEETNLTYTYLSGLYGVGSYVDTYLTATVTDNTNSVVVKFTNINSHKFAATFSYKAYPIFIDGGTAEETVMETWEFTLEDGSTVEKEIEVGA